MRIDPASLDQLLHPTIDPNAKRRDRHRPAPLRPARSGEIAFSSDEAAVAGRRPQGYSGSHRNSPEDIHGMHAAEGILTTRGGMIARRRGRARHGVRVPVAAPSASMVAAFMAIGARPRPATSSPSTARWARCCPAACR